MLKFSLAFLFGYGDILLVRFEEYIVGYHYIVPVRFEEYIFVIPFKASCQLCPVVTVSSYLCATMCTLFASSLHTAEELLTDELHADQDGELAAEESLTDELKHSLRLMEYPYAVPCTSLSSCADGHCR